MQYLINSSEEQCHRNTINTLLNNVVCFDCMVAFAKISGFRMIEEALINALKRNQNNRQARFRFIFGLDFYQTEPNLLYEILKLSQEYPNLSLFLSKNDCVFHPKVYAFGTERANYMIIGSANLTGGGLVKNNESSLLVKSTEMRETILNQIEGLIKNNKIIEATKDNISKYEEKYDIYNVRKVFFDSETNDAIQNPVEGDFKTLEAILFLMKQKGEFELDVERRIKSRRYAIEQLNHIANEPNIDNARFLELYMPLVSNPHHYWHSGFLGFHAGQVARVKGNPRLFQLALIAVRELNNPTPREAYLTLHSIFNNITYAGVNVITEILHTIDNKKFAVMNNNSVSGMERANYSFPETTMNNVDCDMYQNFCNSAKDVCQSLGFKNFTELDALLNYAYWNVNE
jgi:HKD family nuclease